MDSPDIQDVISVIKQLHEVSGSFLSTFESKDACALPDVVKADEVKDERKESEGSPVARKFYLGDPHPDNSTSEPKLYRVVAARSFGDVEAGDIGGWIEKEENLSHEGLCWVYGEAIVSDDARVSNNAVIYDEAVIDGKSKVCDNAHVFDNARVSGEAEVCCEACVYEDAVIAGYARIFGEAEVFGHAQIFGHVEVFENANICGHTSLYEDLKIGGSIKITSGTLSGDVLLGEE